jgi:hypothetical protein
MVVSVARVAAPGQEVEYIFIPVVDTASLYDFMFTEEVGTVDVKFHVFPFEDLAKQFIDEPTKVINCAEELTFVRGERKVRYMGAPFFMTYDQYEKRCIWEEEHTHEFKIAAWGLHD